MRHFAVMSVIGVLVFGMFAVTLQAKEKTNSNPLTGTWKCIAHGGKNGNIPFTLYIEHSSQGYTGTVSAPQGDTDLTSVTFKNKRLKIDIDTNVHNYALTATLAKGKLTGEWYLDGQKRGAWEGKK